MLKKKKENVKRCHRTEIRSFFKSEQKQTNKKHSESKNTLEATTTAKRVVLDEKNPHSLDKLEWQPIEIQYTELKIQILFNDATLKQCHTIDYVSFCRVWRIKICIYVRISYY